MEKQERVNMADNVTSPTLLEVQERIERIALYLFYEVRWLTKNLDKKC